MSKIDRPTIKATLINDVKLAEIEKKAKAFDIIKNKKVDILWFRKLNDRINYNTMKNIEDELTQEEFDLLKELLK